MTERERLLLESARAALRWFVNREQGHSGFNGLHDDILIARRLRRSLEGYPDVPAVTDADRADPLVVSR